MKNTITDINWNGSKWYGQQPDSIEVLLETLEKYTLDPTFEDFGNFVCPFIPAKGWNDENEKYKGCTSISGNFLTYSHSFGIITNDSETIERLTLLIRKNQQRDEYKETKTDMQIDKKVKGIAQAKFYNKELSLQELHNFQSSDEGIETYKRIKNEMFSTV